MGANGDGGACSGEKPLAVGRPQQVGERSVKCGGAGAGTNRQRWGDRIKSEMGECEEGACGGNKPPAVDETASNRRGECEEEACGGNKKRGCARDTNMGILGNMWKYMGNIQRYL